MRPTEPCYRIIIRRNLRRIAIVELRGPRLTLGRIPACDIVLPHPSVSRQHAALELQSGQWHLADQGSTNGLLVNGQRAQSAILRPGDVAEIRPFSLEVLSPTQRPDEDLVPLSAADEVRTVASLPVSSQGVAQRRLEDLYALARFVIRRQAAQRFWPALQAALRQALTAHRCEVIGLDDSQRLFRLTFADSAAPGHVPVGLSRSVIREVSSTQRAVLVECVRPPATFAGAASLIAAGAGSVLCAPVVVAGSTRALVYADREASQPPYQREDLEFITAAVDLAAAAAELDELHDSARELAQVHGRIAAGREMQELLFPSPIPQPAWGVVAAVNQPAERMSGDIYDVLLDGQGRLVTMLADVSGKGVPAALLTAVLQNTLRLTLPETENLAAVVQRLNAVFCGYNAAGTFATLVLCRWSHDGRAVELANAGHPAPLWLRKDGTCTAFPTHIGIALGVEQNWTGTVAQCDAHDVVAQVAYSDGASEARNERGEQYGQQRLRQRLEQLGSATASHLVGELARGVRNFCAPAEPADDVTFLAVTRPRA